jgi:carbonic anhydrase
MQLAASMSGSLTKEQRDSMTPSQVIDELKKGNERFRAGKMASRDYLAEKRSSSAGQYPAAIILGCVDSRVPAEIIFDAGIGDTFNGRVAGNVVNDDQLGSMEFACAVSGSKLVLVLGHVDHIAGNAPTKRVADPSVENDFRRHPRVDASKDYRRGILAGST